MTSILLQNFKATAEVISYSTKILCKFSFQIFETTDEMQEECALTVPPDLGLTLLIMKIGKLSVSFFSPGSFT